MIQRGLAVDIDETLAQTNLVWARHHIKIYGNPEGLSADDIILKYRFVKDVPYWQNEKANRWIDEQMNSDEAILDIPVIEDSIKVMKKIPVACYLTNRPECTTDATKKWLKKYGFPEAEMLASSDGLEWKAKKLTEMYPIVFGIIDDNVCLISYINLGYKGKFFLYSHTKPLKSELDIILCPKWADIEKNIQQIM